MQINSCFICEFDKDAVMDNAAVILLGLNDGAINIGNNGNNWDPKNKGDTSTAAAGGIIFPLRNTAKVLDARQFET